MQWHIALAFASLHVALSRSATAVMHHLVHMCEHVALALDGTLAQADKHVALVLGLLHNSIADMHAAGEAVALHAAGDIHCVS